MTNTEHTTTARGPVATCSCGWGIDYSHNGYMTIGGMIKEAHRAARLHPVREANRHHETTPSHDGWTGD